MITTEEKIALAKELKLDSIARVLIEKAETAKAIQLLTGMKFKPITREQIRAKLPKFYWSLTDTTMWGFNLLMLGALLGIPITALADLLRQGLTGHLTKGGDPSPIGCSIVWVIWMTIVFIWNAYQPVEMRANSLTSWFGDLPYGALLAVKEAKEQGIEKFCIYYPVNADHERLKRDPVITGEFHGVELEIFAWDDGKIYE